MTTERSTYTYEDGVQETVTLRRSHITPRGHALLQISCSDGRRADCYVDLAWLRDRADQLARQRPEGAERWEDFLIDSLDYQALTDQQITDLADRIAEEMNR